jgi:hypothetical protein
MVFCQEKVVFSKGLHFFKNNSLYSGWEICYDKISKNN